MNFMSLVKRIAPFALTFAVGLFIASFFVTVAAPTFQFRRGFSRHREYHRRIEFENQQLRDENNRLKNRLAEMEKREWVLGTADVPMTPAPPAPPTIQMKTVPSRSR